MSNVPALVTSPTLHTIDTTSSSSSTNAHSRPLPPPKRIWLQTQFQKSHLAAQEDGKRRKTQEEEEEGEEEEGEEEEEQLQGDLLQSRDTNSHMEVLQEKESVEPAWKGLKALHRPYERDDGTAILLPKMIAFDISPEKKRFYIHTAKLSAKSPGLRALLNGTYRHIPKKKITLCHIDTETFRRFIQWLYEGVYNYPSLSKVAPVQRNGNHTSEGYPQSGSDSKAKDGTVINIPRESTNSKKSSTVKPLKSAINLRDTPDPTSSASMVIPNVVLESQIGENFTRPGVPLGKQKILHWLSGYDPNESSEVQRRKAEERKSGKKVAATASWVPEAGDDATPYIGNSTSTDPIARTPVKIAKALKEASPDSDSDREAVKSEVVHRVMRYASEIRGGGHPEIQDKGQVYLQPNTDTGTSDKSPPTVVDVTKPMRDEIQSTTDIERNEIKRHVPMYPGPFSRLRFSSFGRYLFASPTRVKQIGYTLRWNDIETIWLPDPEPMFPHISMTARTEIIAPLQAHASLYQLACILNVPALQQDTIANILYILFTVLPNLHSEPLLSAFLIFVESVFHGPINERNALKILCVRFWGIVKSRVSRETNDVFTQCCAGSIEFQNMEIEQQHWIQKVLEREFTAEMEWFGHLSNSDGRNGDEDLEKGTAWQMFLQMNSLVSIGEE